MFLNLKVKRITRNWWFSRMGLIFSTELNVDETQKKEIERVANYTLKKKNLKLGQKMVPKGLIIPNR